MTPSSWWENGTVSLRCKGGCTVSTYPVVEEGNHPIWIHGFTDVKLEILEVGDNFLGVGRSSLFEGFDTFRLRLREFSLDCFHVALEISQIGLLVECGGLKSEGVDDVVNLSGCIVNSLFLLLSRGVSACPGSVVTPGTVLRIHNTDVNISTRLDGNQGAVNLEDDIIDGFSEFPFIN